jgi:glycosyltransferase involved in cell wall biosynthesis
MKRRIVMVLSNDAVSDPRVEKEADALTSAGYEVVVLAWDRARMAPATEARRDWRIERIGPSAAHGAGLRSLPAYRQFWRDASARALELRPDAVHCHDLDTALVGVQVIERMRPQRPFRPRLVLDFHELYRESRILPQSGAKGAVAKGGARWIEGRTIPRADLVITVSPGQVDYYRELGAEDRVVLVENAPDLERFAPVGLEPERVNDAFTVCFIGQKRYAEGLLALMEAIQLLPGARALLVGGGPAQAEIAEAAVRFERVEVSGRVLYDDIPALYARSDAVYAAYDTSLGNWRSAFPVKAQEAMASGLPMIAAKGSWLQTYVEEHGLGIAVDELDVEDVRAAIRRLMEDPALAAEMGRRGRTISETELNWRAASDRLVAAYEGLWDAAETEDAGKDPRQDAEA